MVYPFPLNTPVADVVPAKLPVIDPDTQKVLIWVDDHAAREMIKSAKARFLRTRQKIYGLELIERRVKVPEKPTVIRKRGAPGDSHRQERTDNPPGVWTIDRVAKSKRTIFLQVLSDCSGRRAA